MDYTTDFSRGVAPSEGSWRACSRHLWTPVDTGARAFSSSTRRDRTRCSHSNGSHSLRSTCTGDSPRCTDSTCCCAHRNTADTGLRTGSSNRLPRRASCLRCDTRSRRSRSALVRRTERNSRPRRPSTCRCSDCHRNTAAPDRRIRCSSIRCTPRSGSSSRRRNTAGRRRRRARTCSPHMLFRLPNILPHNTAARGRRTEHTHCSRMSSRCSNTRPRNMVDSHHRTRRTDHPGTRPFPRRRNHRGSTYCRDRRTDTCRTDTACRCRTDSHSCNTLRPRRRTLRNDPRCMCQRRSHDRGSRSRPGGRRRCSATGPSIDRRNRATRRIAGCRRREDMRAGATRHSTGRRDHRRSPRVRTRSSCHRDRTPRCSHHGSRRCRPASDRCVAEESPRRSRRRRCRKYRRPVTSDREDTSR